MIFPVSPGLIQIDTTPTATSTFVEVSNMEEISLSFDNNIEEWTPLGNDGWANRLKTGQSVTVSISGKRDVGDPGNDYVAGTALAVGTAANTTLKLDFTGVDASLGVFTIPCVISVTDMFGASTDVAALNWEAQSRGIVTFMVGSGG